MTHDFESQLQRLARMLAEIARTLESVDDSPARVEQVLTSLAQIVPYRRCALLEVRDDGSEHLHVVPAQVDAALHASMTRVFHLVSRTDHVARSPEPAPGLSLPVVGLDSVIGVLRVEPAAATTYDATHLRVLAVVAAQLGAYLTTHALRQRDRAREQQLAAAHDFQQLVAGVVSHDLRSPLSVIMTVATNLLESTVDPRQAEYLRRALRNAEHAARLIADLADVTEARVSGTMTLELESTALLESLRAIVGDLRSAHPTATIELFCDVDATTAVTWDMARVTQVLTNLVNNALAHGAAGLPVRVTAWSEGADVSLSVHNYGAAIAPELRRSIFDPFRHGAERPRAHSVRGLGLGLFIVDQIAKAHGGAVDLTTDVALGTTFTIRLPRVCTAAANRPRVVVDAPPGEAPLVMVVDDDDDVRLTMAGALEKRGFRAIGAADGVEALALLATGLRPRLILLDLTMPRMSGEELYDRLRADPELASIPVVVVSADTASALRISGERAKAFLAKPITVDKLLAALEHIR